MFRTAKNHVTFIALLSCCLFTGCLTSRKVDKQVAKQYSGLQQPAKKKQSDFITITSPLLTDDQRISTTETRTSDLLPLLIYWQWDYKNTCTLNPQIPVNNLAATVVRLANKGLKDKLDGRKIELSVNQVPNKFAIDDKAHLIFVGYAFGWDNVSIKAESMDMIVAYTVTKDNAIVKKGTIDIPYGNDKKKLGMFKSWKKATSEYLDQYDANIIAMSKEVVDELVKEL